MVSNLAKLFLAHRPQGARQVVNEQPTTQTANYQRQRDTGRHSVRVELWILIAAAFATGFVVVDCVSFRPMTGHSLRGVDYLVLSSAIGFLACLLFWREVARKLAISLLMVMFLLGMIEGAVAIMSGGHQWHVWPPNLVYHLRPQGLPGVAQRGTFSTNSRGIRGPEFSKDDQYRILCIGGSTTECLYLDDSRAWPTLLGERLSNNGSNVWVGNVGRAGLIAHDHVTLLKHLPEAKRVDCWVVLCGINDMGQQLRGVYADCVARTVERTFSETPHTSASSLRRPLHRNLWVLRRIESLRPRFKEVTAQVNDTDVVQDRNASWVQQSRGQRRSGKIIDQLPPLDAYLDEYERELVAMVQLAKTGGKRLVLVTQPTIWRGVEKDKSLRRYTLGGKVAENTYLATRPRAEGIEQYNQRMKRVAERFDVECIDLASELPPTLDVFYDDCHFNDSGAQRVAKVLATAIERR